MSDFVYRPQVEGELLRAAPMRGVLARLATAGAEGARRWSPLRTGAYQDSISGGIAINAHGVPVARIASTDPFAHIVEFGSINSVPYAPLRKGVETLGLIVTDRRGT